MKILAIDTSGSNCSVSIINDSSIMADFTICNGITHSQNLVPMIEQAQKFANIELDDIDVFACSIGPRFVYRFAYRSSHNQGLCTKFAKESDWRADLIIFGV